VHARADLPGTHPPARRAVVDEHARTRRLPAQHHLFARIDQREPAAAQRPGRGVEVDVVRHGTGDGIDQRDLDVIALVDDHQWSGDRAVERHRLQLGAGFVDDDLLLLGHQCELENLRSLPGRLFVRMHEGRRHELDLLPWQLAILGRGRPRKDDSRKGGAREGDVSGDRHDQSPFVQLWRPRNEEAAILQMHARRAVPWAGASTLGWKLMEAAQTMQPQIIYLSILPWRVLFKFTGCAFVSLSRWNRALHPSNKLAVPRIVANGPK